MTQEKLPERFEKDFFKHEKKQRSWNELEVGEVYSTEPFEVSLERIQLYAAGTEDYNPLYYDEEAAKNSQFGGLIAPPPSWYRSFLPHYLQITGLKYREPSTQAKSWSSGFRCGRVTPFIATYAW